MNCDTVSHSKFWSVCVASYSTWKQNTPKSNNDESEKYILRHLPIYSLQRKSPQPYQSPASNTTSGSLNLTLLEVRLSVLDGTLLLPRLPAVMLKLVARPELSENVDDNTVLLHMCAAISVGRTNCLPRCGVFRITSLFRTRKLHSAPSAALALLLAASHSASVYVGDTWPTQTILRS